VLEGDSRAKRARCAHLARLGGRGFVQRYAATELRADPLFPA
jgi:hypothetical protein